MSEMSDAAKSAWQTVLRSRHQFVRVADPSGFDELRRDGLLSLAPRIGDDYHFYLTERGQEERRRALAEPTVLSHDDNEREIRALVGPDDPA